MVAYERASDIGDTRYHREHGTQTAATYTAFTWSLTTCNGASYHSYQVELITVVTSTSSYTMVLQGSLEPNTSTVWANIEGSTMGISGTGTTKLLAFSTPIPLNAVRPSLVTVGTAGSSSMNVWVMGNATTFGRT